jgi:DNA-directed RNA polymerase subunit alpha
MFNVQCLQSTANESTNLYAKYSLGPFMKGQSLTTGNALRRVLLSNLQGLAIVGARITGINHEFSTIPNVKEDVIDILLNLKQIKLKGNITEPTLARLVVNGPSIVTAKDFELTGNITLVDSQQYIASLTANGSLEMEVLIARGQNYISSAKIDSIIPAGFLAVDGIFMPVNQVNFFVETSKNNSSSELECLILEIWTNGTISPADALSSSAKILEDSFGLLKITDTLPTLALSMDTSSFEEEKEEHLETIFIEELELSVRAYNCLKRANIHTLSDLLQYSADDLLEFKNFGQKSADEVCERVKVKFDKDLHKKLV